MAEKKPKILVVDDEKIVRDFFKRLISLLDVDVLEAPDGYTAIEMARNNDIGLFFIDVRMPGINGLETTREIRKINPLAAVVIITGYAVDDVLDALQKEGIEGIIHKPFEIGQIKEVINNFSKEELSRPLNILVIDDDEAILGFFSNFLKDKGFKYKTARDKKEALEAVNSEKFDLVFLDLVLKEDDGRQIYEEFQIAFPGMDIVLMTGYPQKAKELEGKFEFAGCLYKPFDIKNIVHYIRKAKR